MVHCFETSYFCNAATEHSRYPAAVTRMLRSRIRRYRVEFVSDYGQSRGASAPSEGLDIWHRWFPDGYVDERYLSIDAANDLQRTVRAVAAVLKAPFVNKDPHHCVRLRALDTVLPGCLFLYIHRDPMANAASILNVRMKRADQGQGDLSTWISVKPKEYAGIAQDGYITQICGQVYYCARNALDDLKAVAQGRYLMVSYEDLCADPGREVDRIRAFARTNGVPVHQREHPPALFPKPRPPPIPEADREAIRLQFVKLCGEPELAATNE